MRSPLMHYAAIAIGVAAAYGALMADARGRAAVPIPPSVQIVGIANGDVVTMSSQSPANLVPLTHDAGINLSPVWSPDGSKIAYTRLAHRWTGADHGGELIVIDPGGRILSRTSVDYVTNLIWIDERRVMISDSINPSASYYSVIDVRNGKFVERDMFDSLSALSFSRHGTKYVRTDDCPHFSPQSECNPDIHVNERLVLSLKGVETKLVIPPVWSDAGNVLGLVTYSLHYDKLSAIFIDAAEPTEPRISRVSVPAMDTDSLNARWVAGKFYVYGTQRGLRHLEATWLIDAAANLARSSRPIAEDDAGVTSAQKLHDTLAEAAKSHGVTAIDFWCAHCPLSVLPRAVHDGTWPP